MKEQKPGCWNHMGKYLQADLSFCYRKWGELNLQTIFQKGEKYESVTENWKGITDPRINYIGFYCIKKALTLSKGRF